MNEYNENDGLLDNLNTEYPVEKVFGNYLNAVKKLTGWQAISVFRGSGFRMEGEQIIGMFASHAANHGQWVEIPTSVQPEDLEGFLAEYTPGSNANGSDPVGELVSHGYVRVKEGDGTVYGIPERPLVEFIQKRIERLSGKQ